MLDYKEATLAKHTCSTLDPLGLPPVLETCEARRLLSRCYQTLLAPKPYPLCYSWAR